MIWRKFVWLTNLFARPWWSRKKRIFILTHQRKQINFNALQLQPLKGCKKCEKKIHDSWMNWGECTELRVRFKSHKPNALRIYYAWTYLIKKMLNTFFNFQMDRLNRIRHGSLFAIGHISLSNINVLTLCLTYFSPSLKTILMHFLKYLLKYTTY